MWLANGSTATGNFTYLSFKSWSDYPTPVFVKKTNGEVETFTAISGALEDIEVKDGRFGKEFSLVIVDNGEKFKVQFWFNNNLWTSILNSLAWLTSVNFIELSCYSKDGYGRVSVKNDGQSAQWKYSLEDLKEYTSIVKLNWQDHKDKTRLFELMENEMIPTIKETLSNNNF